MESTIVVSLFDFDLGYLVEGLCDGFFWIVVFDGLLERK